MRLWMSKEIEIEIEFEREGMLWAITITEEEQYRVEGDLVSDLIPDWLDTFGESEPIEGFVLDKNYTVVYEW